MSWWQQKLAKHMPESRHFIYEADRDVFRVTMRDDGTFDHQKQISQSNHNYRMSFAWDPATNYKTLDKLMKCEGWLRRPESADDDSESGDDLEDQMNVVRKRLVHLEAMMRHEYNPSDSE